MSYSVKLKCRTSAINIMDFLLCLYYLNLTFSRNALNYICYGARLYLINVGLGNGLYALFMGYTPLSHIAWLAIKVLDYREYYVYMKQGISESTYHGNLR